MDKINVLLLGGAGFLGVSLQQELASRGVGFKVVDLVASDFVMDLADSACIDALAKLMASSCKVVQLAAKVGSKLFESESAVAAAEANRTIDANVMNALKVACLDYKHAVDFTYFSTSEVYG